jgi:hypothetical protein
MTGTVPLNHVRPTLSSTPIMPYAPLDLFRLCLVSSSLWLICQRRSAAARCASELELSKHIAAAESDRAFETLWE